MYSQVTFLSYEISTYIAVYLCAIFVGVLLLRHEFSRHGYPPRFYAVLLSAVLVSALVGAKLYFLIETWPQVVAQPNMILVLSGSGWYGGFLFGGLAAIVTIRIVGLPVLRTLDVLAPILPLGQAIGRLGCFLGGCCHGPPSDVPWAVAFSDGLFPPYVRVHPTQLYEMAVYLAIFVFLWKKRDTLKVGHSIGLYLLLAGGGRFLLEMYRLNPKIIYQLTAPQVFALACMLAAVMLLFRPAPTNLNASTRGA